MQQSAVFVLIVIAVAAVGPAPAIHAQTKLVAGDPAAGRIFALRACTGCHIVAPDQLFKPVFTGPPHPPDFKDIANKPNVTAAMLQRHLSSLPTVPQRPSMADPVLTSQQLRDVTAFIVSLRDKPVAPTQ
jgi:mono/diheme cytochrome c family protein